MTYYSAQQLAASFRTVRGNTLTIARDIPESQYGFRPAPGSRSVEQTLIHIATAPRMAEQIQFIERRTTLVGFDFFGFHDALHAEEDAPHSKQQVLDLLGTEGEKLAGLLEGATEEFLAERVSFPEGMQPPSKSRFEMLLGLKEHEMHHRGQLMLVERLLGIVPHLTRDMQARIAAMRAGR